MDILSLYGSGMNPDIIIGKYSTEGMNPAVANVLDNNPAFKSWSGARVNKYELWFSTTISFIPYSGESVFITDVSGNLTHNGNLLTKGHATIKGDSTVEKNATVKGNSVVEGNITVQKDVEIKNNLTVRKEVVINENTKIDKDLRVEGSLYVNGINIFSILDDLKVAADAAKTTVSTGGQSSPGGTSGDGSGGGQGSFERNAEGETVKVPTKFPDRVFIGPPPVDSNSPYWTDEELIAWAEYFQVPTDSVLIELPRNPMDRGNQYLWIDPRATDIIDIALRRKEPIYFGGESRMQLGGGITARETALMNHGIYLTAPSRRTKGVIEGGVYSDTIQRPRIRNLVYNTQVNTQNYLLQPSSVTYWASSQGLVSQYGPPVEVVGDLFYPFWTSEDGTVNIQPNQFGATKESPIIVDNDSSWSFSLSNRSAAILEVFDSSVNLNELPFIYNGNTPVNKLETPAVTRRRIRDVYDINGGLIYNLKLRPGYKYRLILSSWLRYAYGLSTSYNPLGFHNVGELGTTILGPDISLRLGTHTSTGSPKLTFRVGGRDYPTNPTNATGATLGKFAVYRSTTNSRDAEINVSNPNQVLEVFIDTTNGSAVDALSVYTTEKLDGSVRNVTPLPGNRLVDIPFGNGPLSVDQLRELNVIE